MAQLRVNPRPDPKILDVRKRQGVKKKKDGASKRFQDKKRSLVKMMFVDCLMSLEIKLKLSAPNLMLSADKTSRRQ